MARKTKVWKRVAIFSAIAMMLTANIFSAGGVYAAGENGQFDAVLPTEISRNAGEQGDYVLTVSSNMTISEDNLAAIQAELKAVYEALYGKTDEINEIIALLDALDSKLSGFNPSISDDDWENGVAAAIEKARELSLAEAEKNVYESDKTRYDGIYKTAYDAKILELKQLDQDWLDTEADYSAFFDEGHWNELDEIYTTYSDIFDGVAIGQGVFTPSLVGFEDLYDSVIANVDPSEYSDDKYEAARDVLDIFNELDGFYQDAYEHESWDPSETIVAAAVAAGNDAKNTAVAEDAEEDKADLNEKIDGLVDDIYEHYGGIKGDVEIDLDGDKTSMIAAISDNKLALGVILGEIETDLQTICSEYDVYLNKSSGIILKLAVDAEGNTGIASKDLTYRDILENNYTLDDVKINLPVALFSETGKNVTVSSVLSIEVEGGGREAEQFDTGSFDKSYTIPNIADIVKDTFVGGTDLGYYDASVPGFIVQMSDFVTGLVSDLKDDASSLNEVQIESGAAKPYVIKFNITTDLPVIYGGVIDMDEDVVTLEVVPVEVAVVDCGSQVVNAVAGVDDEVEDALTLADLEDEEPTEEPVEEGATEEETGGFSIFPWVMGGALLLIAFVLIVMYRKKSEKAE